MKKLFIITVLLTAIITGYAQSTKIATSDKTGWHKIGETTVSFETDRDELNVTGADKFAAIKFKVKEVPIHLMSLQVLFDGGGNEDINVNFPIKPRGESRVIEFKGGEQDIKKIVFVYKTITNRKDKEAQVEVWGLKTNEDRK